MPENARPEPMCFGKGTRRLDFAAAMLLALVLAQLVHCVRYWNDFAVPNPDFFAFQTTAEELMSGSLPSSYQRAPLYPLLIGILSKFMPAGDRFLMAAELLNLCLSAASLLLVYALARQVTGQAAAFVITWLVALNHVTMFVTTQPILECLLLFTILMTLRLSWSGSRWAYLWAALASLTRYEGAPLILGLVIQDWLSGKRLGRALLLAGCASLGLGAWLALSILHSVRINPYVTYVTSTGLGGLPDLKEFVQSVFSFIPSASLVSADLCALVRWAVKLLGCAAMGLGLWLLASRHPIRALPTLVFFAFYVLIHVAHASTYPRFAYPVLWLLYTFLVLGVASAWSWIESSPTSRRFRTCGRFQERTSIGLCGITGLAVFAMAFACASQRQLGLWLIAPVLFTALPCFWLWRERAKGAISGATATGATLALLFVACGDVWATRQDMARARHARAELRQIGEWAGQHLKTDEKIAMVSPWIAQHYSGLPRDRFLALKDLDAQDMPSFIAELQRRGATHVAWDSYYESNPEGYYARKFKAGLAQAVKRGEARDRFKEVHRINIPGGGSAVIYEFSRP